MMDCTITQQRDNLKTCKANRAAESLKHTNIAETKNKGDIGDFLSSGNVIYTFRRSLENKTKKSLVTRVKLKAFCQELQNRQTLSTKMNLLRAKKLHYPQESA